MTTPKIPQPRALNQIIEKMKLAVTAKLIEQGKPAPTFDKGGPLLSIIEAASLSDAATSKDLFDNLLSRYLEDASDSALDEFGQSLSPAVPRKGQRKSTGFVTIFDSSFKKIQLNLYLGAPTPQIGSNQIFVNEEPPVSGSIYIGRGTNNYEGPLPFSSITNLGSFFSINLASSLQKNHSPNEKVVIAQGGDRTVSAGSSLISSFSNSASGVRFTVTKAVAIPDGENEIKNVSVEALNGGIVGNVPAKAINQFQSPPFPGAGVLNEISFSSGEEIETTDEYKERLLKAIKGRILGTPVAIESAVLGVSSDSSETVTAANFVRKIEEDDVLIIDSGDFSELLDLGVPREVLVQKAEGGERNFALSNGTPVVQSFVENERVEPYQLFGGETLVVSVGGQIVSHNFTSQDFASPGQATAIEIASSLNRNSFNPFLAQTLDKNSRIRITPKSSKTNSIQVLGGEANEFLGFSLKNKKTIRLFKNGKELNLDGETASLSSSFKNTWIPPFSSGETLELSIDNKKAITFIFSNQDLISSGAVAASLADASIFDWAKLFNYVITGTTAFVENGIIKIVSNLDDNENSAIEVISGSLVQKNIFKIEKNLGAAKDFYFDLSLGQIELSEKNILSPGDTLVVGAEDTDASLVSNEFKTISFANTSTSNPLQVGAEAYFCFDKNVKINPILSSGTFSVLAAAQPGYELVTMTNPSPVFDKVKISDWIVFLNTPVSGKYKVVSANSNNMSFETKTGVFSNGSFSVNSGDLVSVSTNSQLYRIFIPASSGQLYTPDSLAPQFKGKFLFLDSESISSKKIKISTKSESIIIAAENKEFQKIGFPKNLSFGTEEFNPQIESKKLEFATEAIVANETLVSPGILTTASPIDFKENNILNFSGKLFPAIGEKNLKSSIVEFLTSNTLNIREETSSLTGNNNFWLSRGFDFNQKSKFLIDVDSQNQSNVALSRKIKSTNSNYLLTNEFVDAENSNVSLARIAGLNFPFEDFAIHMRARGKSDVVAGSDTNKTILWRHYRAGAEGENTRIKYVYPADPSSSPKAITKNEERRSTVEISLASGALRTGIVYDSTNFIGITETIFSSNLVFLNLSLGFEVALAKKSASINFTNATVLNFTAGEILTGTVSGATAVVISSVGIGSGTLRITNGNGIPFNPLELVNGSISGPNSLRIAGFAFDGETELTITPPPGVTSIDYTGMGDIFFTSTAANFISGGKKILTTTSVLPLKITYQDNTVLGADVVNPGTISFGKFKKASFLPSNIAASGDIVRLEGQNLPLQFKTSSVVSGLNPNWIATGGAPALALNGVLQRMRFFKIESDFNIKVFPLNAAQNTIVNIANSINSQTNSTVTAVAVGVGGDNSGVITSSTFQQLGQLPPLGPDGLYEGYPLTDGVNWVKTSNSPLISSANYSFTFKKPITSSLSLNSDWQNEDIFLVPVTQKNYLNFSNNPIAGPAFSSVSFKQKEDGTPIIESKNSGSKASIEVKGGSANNVTANVVGAPFPFGVSVRANQADNFSGDSWVLIKNSSKNKKNIFQNSTSLTSIINQKAIISTNCFSFVPGTSVLANNSVSFHKENKLTRVSFLNSLPLAYGLAEEGDIIHLSNISILSSGNASPSNLGFFRIVKNVGDSKNFYIENEKSVEESAPLNFCLLKATSLLPGDEIEFSTNVWGQSLVGKKTVSSISLETLTGQVTAQNSFTFNESVENSASKPALGVNSNLIQVTDSLPVTFYKKILGIEKNQQNQDFNVIKFYNQQGLFLISENFGSVLTQQGVLGFEKNKILGVDGYIYSTGIVSEVKKVVFGVDSDRLTFPGVAAAGARIRIQQSIIKPIKISISIKQEFNFLPEDMVLAVRSAATSYINSLNSGDDVVFGKIVGAVQEINGVKSVAIASPLYNVVQDSIPSASFEKPKILNQDKDIEVIIQ
jgi:hypothetical protein